MKRQGRKSRRGVAGYLAVAIVFFIVAAVKPPGERSVWIGLGEVFIIITLALWRKKAS